VVAASCFIYIAVADLLPQLQRRLPWRETAAQLAWLGAGLALVVFVLGGLHSH
jgi:zinc and cadmium transporter